MSRPERSAQLADLLKQRIAASEARPLAPPSDEARSRAITEVEVALVARRRRLARRTWLRFGSAAAAAAVLVVVGAAVGTRAGPAPVSVRASGAGGEAKLSNGAKVPFGDHVRLDDGTRLVASEGGEVSVGFASGTELTLRDRGMVSLLASGKTKAFRLDAGSLVAHVAKLAGDERFVVHTADAEVEVRGTRFAVSVVPPRACAAGATTEVHVTEGAVVVRTRDGEARLGPGDSWPGCVDAATPAPPVMSSSPAHHEPAPAPSAALVAASTASTSPHGSSLAEENTLYQRGLRAKREGDTTSAIASFEKLLADHPRSPLAESAAVERMRLLTRSGQTDRARAAARDYLARYPHGDARAEAEGVVRPR